MSVGTKQVLMDFYKDGNGVAFGKVAESSGKVEFGWPLVLSQPLGVDQGGTGSSTASAACSNLGAVKKSGDTMTGNLSISGYLYPSLYLGIRRVFLYFLITDVRSPMWIRTSVSASGFFFIFPAFPSHPHNIR